MQSVEPEDQCSYIRLDGTIPDITSDIYSYSSDGIYLAVPNLSYGIDLFVTDSETNEVKLLMSLKGHRSAVPCLRFSHGIEPVLLISSAKDYIIRWNITECFINHHNGVTAIRGTVIMQCPSYEVSAISWSYEDDVLAISAGYEVIIYNTQVSDTAHVLRGHTDRVTCAEFCPHYDFTLVSASIDRTYMIWNVQSGDLLYKSAIISSSPFEHLVMSQTREEFVLVSGDGMIRFYDISSESDFSQLRCVDTERLLNAVTKDGDEIEPTAYSACVLSFVLLSIPLEYTDSQHVATPNISQENHTIRSLFGMIDLLVFITASHTLIVNARTGELVAAQLLTQGCVSSALLCATPASCTSDDADEDSSYAICCLTRQLMGKGLTVSTISPLTAYLQTQLGDHKLSVISRIPVQAGSPLKYSLVPKQSPKPANKKPGAKFKPKLSSSRKSAGVVDQPIVFRSKVKSSGYASTHNKRTMFHPQTVTRGSPKLQSSNKPQKEKVYPAESSAITKAKGEMITVDTRPTQIMAMDFSVDGRSLALACSNNQTYSFKLPLNSAKSTVYSGHTGVVNSCMWSYSGNLLVTSSNDCTVKMWSKDQGTVMLDLDRLDGNLNPVSAAESKRTQRLPGETRGAQFFYIDKFIITACGGSLLMYKYHIDTSRNDIKRYENGSRYKLVVQLKMESAQNITSVSAINTFYSHLVLAAGSDRSMQVFDMNRSSQSRIIENCHNRPAHHVTQNEGSLYSSMHYSAYDLFLTSSVGDGVKLWDLRTQSCVRKFESHVSKAFACSCDFSPDGRFMASGSEDKSFYVYDIGSGKLLNRVKGPSDVCTNVLYHPLYPQLAAGTMCGAVSMYES